MNGLYLYNDIAVRNIRARYQQNYTLSSYYEISIVCIEEI